MFLARMVFFRLHESPRYLVHAGRHQEAIESLQMISKFNGSELELDVEDVRDHLRPSEILLAQGAEAGSARCEPEVVFSVGDEDGVGEMNGSSGVNGVNGTNGVKETARPPALVSKGSRQVLRSSPESDLPGYSSTGEQSVSLSEHTFQVPNGTSSIDSHLGDHANHHPANADDGEEYENENEDEDEDGEDAYLKGSRRADASVSVSSSSSSVRSRRDRSVSSARRVRSKLYDKLPRSVRRPLYAWIDRVGMVLSPEWIRTTVLVWIVWCAMSLGAFL